MNPTVLLFARWNLTKWSALTKLISALRVKDVEQIRLEHPNKVRERKVQKSLWFLKKLMQWKTWCQIMINEWLMNDYEKLMQLKTSRCLASLRGSAGRNSCLSLTRPSSSYQVQKVPHTRYNIKLATEKLIPGTKSSLVIPSTEKVSCRHKIKQETKQKPSFLNSVVWQGCPISCRNQGRSFSLGKDCNGIDAFHLGWG